MPTLPRPSLPCLVLSGLLGSLTAFGGTVIDFGSDQYLAANGSPTHVMIASVDFDADGNTLDSRRTLALTENPVALTGATFSSYWGAASTFSLNAPVGAIPNQGSGGFGFRNGTVFPISTQAFDPVRLSIVSSAPGLKDVGNFLLLFGGPVGALNADVTLEAHFVNQFKANVLNTLRWVVYDATLDQYLVSQTAVTSKVDDATATLDERTISLGGAALAAESWAAINPATLFDGTFANLFNSATATFSPLELTNVTRAGLFLETLWVSNTAGGDGTGAGGASLDIGTFRVTAVPEPSLAAPLLAGLVGALVLLRRRR